MQIGIYGTGTTSNSAKTVKKILDDSDIDSFPISKSKNKQADCVIVLGGDKGVRNYFHRTFDSTCLFWESAKVRQVDFWHK